MHIFVQEFNKTATFPPLLCDILLKSLHFVKESIFSQSHDVTPSFKYSLSISMSFRTIKLNLSSV